MTRRITPPAPPVTLPPGTVHLTIDGKRAYYLLPGDKLLLDNFPGRWDASKSGTRPTEQLATSEECIRVFEGKR